MFLIVLLIGLFIHLMFLFVPHFLFDETFYASIPFRLANGDSLIQHEWHLSQFSALFSFLPVKAWLVFHGSTNGIILFLRCVYLFIHTAAATAIYIFFRSDRYWAIAAALVFYLQTPYKIYAISYNSMFALFLLLFTLGLLSVFRKASLCAYLFSGICFGACCINNPAFCIIIVLYPIVFLLWKSEWSFFESSRMVKLKAGAQKGKSRKEYRNALKKAEQAHLQRLKARTSYQSFFNKQAVGYLFLGISIVAVISILFFYITGGKMSLLFHSIANLLKSSEYGIASRPFSEKFKQIQSAIETISCRLPFLLPLLFICIFLDKKRANNTHRFIYLFFCFLLSLLYITGMFLSVNQSSTLFLSLPFSLLSFVCYLLTEKKNKPLFCCMWCPCAIAAIINLFVSNTLLSSAGFVMAIGNIPGVFFSRDLIKEIRMNAQTHTRASNKSWGSLCSFVICAGFLLQLVFYGFVIQYGQLLPKNSIKVTDGPYSGMQMTEDQYFKYQTSLKDLEQIKQRSNTQDPVLVVSFQNWMYLSLDRPIATYTTWYQGMIQKNNLITYYHENPDRIPKYIYIVNRDVVEITNIDSDNIDRNIEILQSMFDYTEEKLPGGLLLTVDQYHFDI